MKRNIVILIGAVTFVLLWYAADLPLDWRILFGGLAFLTGSLAEAMGEKK